MRLLAFIEYAAVAIGLIAMAAGHFFSLPRAFHLGVFMAGAGIALGGLEALATRRMCFRASEDAYEAHAGAPAMIVGTMALLVGAGIIAAAYLLADGLWHATVYGLARRPAPALVAAGLLLAGSGALMMLSAPRSLGTILMLGGLAAIGLGVWEWLEPAAFDRFAAKLPRRLDWPPSMSGR